MQKTLITSLFLGALLVTSPFQHAPVQAQTTKAVSVIPWFAVKNSTIVVQTGDKAKTLDKDVTLPNGIRIEHLSRSIVLTNGNRVKLKEGDMLSLNGEFIRKNAAPQPEVAAVPAPATLSASAAPAAAAPAPVSAPVPTVAPAATPTFTYRPTAPVDGKLKGVVELGASGFNLFIVRADNQHNWKLEKSEFGNSLVMENMATEEDVRNGLKSYIGKMLDFGVAGRDIHFMVSSGAAMSDVTRRIVKSLESLKYVVNTVTPEREGTLGLKAALPMPFADKAFMLDMGSANSKIAWLADGQPHVEDTYGSKYYEKDVPDATVIADVKAKAAKVPGKLRSTCFVIGGIPYELAKAVRQGQEPYTVLKAADAYPQLSGAKIKSGLNIYQAVAAATGCQQFVFGYDANFTIGYLLSLP
ncbi:DUF6799 domain-containing protein [Hymenobacter siberiensis]|jgi:hypothetical protein|uniref:DUF6799 domain-containing protein n=1 Tax=Hymenobacter siberiensis TaxID=2848396 RepID=UPI001C1E372C|nr:DUF6799 domain-containing protein [Hymenobacter siberiensis]MBU6122391.1 hypothetical protein [Hymenobacter siberiensis]